ncbi:MAG: tyrosine-type recombinase/integrase [Tolypothrix sp. Co-bin9]|nr:tyrosine-type recombinase/integrase [Tolypothrix sp. Co-bin9]
MKINGHGQAKTLNLEERELLLSEGFVCQRDRTLNEFCYYTACRSGEARQMLYSDVFSGDKVRDTIVIRKNITKGQQATRIIPTHPKLAQSLEKYIEESQELLNIKQLVGQWDYKSLVCGNVFNAQHEIICPKCANDNISTAGKVRGKQLYKCKSCLYRFQVKTAFVEHPELRDRVLKLGVYNSQSYGFLFLNPSNPYLFPGEEGNGCISRTTVKEIFMNACIRAKIIGAGTHSWRRTALTEIHKNNVPLKVIQSISGHARLSNLQKYLEVSPEEVSAAIRYLP